MGLGGHAAFVGLRVPSAIRQTSCPSPSAFAVNAPSRPRDRLSRLGIWVVTRQGWFDRAYGFIRSSSVTDAARHDGKLLRHLVTGDNLTAGVWADSAFLEKFSVRITCLFRIIE